jgi:hypothetical protein
MSKTLEKILLEVDDGMNNYHHHSPDYIRKISASLLDVDDVDEVESLHHELHAFTHGNEDEITINYSDGTEVTLDTYVAKNLLAKFSPEDIDAAGHNSDYLHRLIFNAFDEVVDIEEE